MDQAPGAKSFQTTGEAYDLFMGRYSRRLAPAFADHAGAAPGMSALDVGCGPGALTKVLVDRLGAGAVTACDPSPPFVDACTANCPGVDVRLGRAESIPFDDHSVDAALAQLVLHFVSDPAAAAQELRRVVRPGGVVAACVWDFDAEMTMLRRFWDAASAVDQVAPDEARSVRFGRAGEIVALFHEAGFEELEETTLEVTSAYDGFDELWSGLLAGIGTAGSYLVALDEARQEAVRDELFRRVGSPAGGFELTAVARSTRGRVPM